MDRNAFYDNLRAFNEKDELMHHGILGQKWGVRRYQNPDGSLTEEGKQRYLNPDGSLSDKAPLKIKSAYNRYKAAESKKAFDSGEAYQDDYVYTKEKQAEKLNNAKQNKMYDLNFVEAIQNAENLTDDDVNREYEAYLKNPHKYCTTISVDGMGRITNSLASQQNNQNTQNTKPAPVKEEPKAETSKSNFGPKATPEEEAEFWKSLAKEYEKGNIKPANSKTEPKSQKPTKEQKKEIKAARKEVQKQLDRGTIGNWALLNKAMAELGISSAEQKNMTAADWNRVNEKIKELKK